MRVMIPFKNPRTGEIKGVKLGFSWTLLLFAGAFGLPLFLRKLNMLGIVFLVLWTINLIAGPFGANAPGIQVILFFIFLGLQLWLGFKGNEITAKNYLEHGWNFVEPNNEFTKSAMRAWGISISNESIKNDLGAGTSDSANNDNYHINYNKRKGSPIIWGIIVVIVLLVLVGSFAKNNKAGYNMHTGLDANGLPKCDSQEALETAKQAIEDNVLKNLVNVKVLDIEDIEYVERPTANSSETRCSGTAITNTGKHNMIYTISKSKNGIYVEAVIQ